MKVRKISGLAAINYGSKIFMRETFQQISFHKKRKDKKVVWGISWYLLKPNSKINDPILQNQTFSQLLQWTYVIRLGKNVKEYICMYHDLKLKKGIPTTNYELLVVIHEFKSAAL